MKSSRLLKNCCSIRYKILYRVFTVGKQIDYVARNSIIQGARHSPTSKTDALAMAPDGRDNG
jgi:hypothetical protein